MSCYHFTQRADVKNIHNLLETAQMIEEDPFCFRFMGQDKALGLIFFNPSLRTRLSSQRAAQRLGMSVIVMNIGQEGWQLEFEDGAVMNGAKAEHIKDAAAVMGQYCDLIGIRSFAKLENSTHDYSEQVLNAFKDYAGVPIISLESATRHPLQSLADLITINTYKKTERPKVVLTWAPHPRALPQAVANSFVEWMKVADVELVLTHPSGYELAEEFAAGLKVVYDQDQALEAADFVYAKNWSSYAHYGQILHQDPSWMLSAEKMAHTQNAHFMHCLPVRRNVVVSDAVMDHPLSLVQQQAANRLIAAQAVFAEILTNHA